MEDVRVGPSRIEGLGLFAARGFQAGESVRTLCVAREVTPDTPLRPELGERADHCDYPDGRVVLLGFPDRHINHSCDPNAYVSYRGAEPSFVARRAVRRGEELTIDYNVNITGGTAWACRCGAKRCTGQVVGDYFLLPPAIRREYRPLLADWFVRRNRERLEAQER